MLKMKSLAATALMVALTAPAWATSVALSTNAADAGYGQWNMFSVSELDAQSFGVEWIANANTLSPGFGSPLSFTFTIGAGQVGTFTVVDAVFAGDTFSVTNAGSALGNTSAVAATTYDSAPNIGLDFSGALANPAFSRGVFMLGAGSYSITGALVQSVTFEIEPSVFAPLNTTVGAVSLTVSPVPEPSVYALLLAGLGLMGTMARRKRS